MEVLEIKMTLLDSIAASFYGEMLKHLSKERELTMSEKKELKDYSFAEIRKIYAGARYPANIKILPLSLSNLTK